MEKIDGKWTVFGVDLNDPECLHTVDDAIGYIKEVGFLPLFKNEIPAFSIEERTVTERWWCGEKELDPWEWRTLIVRRGEIAYGKFFGNKTGFISKEWLPYFVNYRRDGYDFDSLWEDGMASRRQKSIMDLFMNENSDAELFSSDVKKMAGFGKGGEKGFDSTISSLQAKLYLGVRDFRQKKNKKGQEYGWEVAIYSTLEHMYGCDFVRSAYGEDPLVSKERLAEHLRDVYSIATEAQIMKILK